MSEREGLINKLKERQWELSRLERRHDFSIPSTLKYEISQTIMQNIAMLGVFLLLGLVIGMALTKRKKA